MSTGLLVHPPFVERRKHDLYNSLRTLNETEPTHLRDETSVAVF